MGISSRMAWSFGKRDMAATEPKAWNPFLWNLRSNASTSGEMVDEFTALTYSAVFNAIQLYSSTIGALPLHIFQRTGKKRVPVLDERVYRTVCLQPNAYMSPMAFEETLVSHMVSWGNCYAEKVYNMKGELVELWPITPNRVRPQWKNSQIVYEIEVGNEKILLGRDKVLHIPGLGFDGLAGYSVIGMARKTIGLGMALETFGSLYFENGTHPGLVVTHPQTLSQSAHNNLKDSLNTAYSGLGKSHRLMLLEEGMTVDKIGIPPEDSQFLESRQFGIPEIARWFNLPPHKLKDLNRSTLNNIESEQISFYTDSILPWLVRIEQAMNLQLLSPMQYFNNHMYFKHNVEGLLRADSTSRGNFYRSMFSVGGISINGILEKEDMDPIDNPYADEPFVPLNMVPLSLIEKMLENKMKGGQGADGNVLNDNGGDQSPEPGTNANNSKDKA